MTSIEEIQLNLVKGAAAAKKSGDYLAYATVIDLNVGNFDDFTSEDAAVVLDTLATTLDQPEYECLVYSIGWDIPELMMWYVDHFHEDNDSAFLTAMSKLGNVLCQKANPKELFLKSCELMEMLDLSVEGADEEEHDEAAADAKEFSANSRFCLLFEMMRFSLNRIETAYPTRFVKTANSVLLAVADAKTDITGVTVVLRRIFVFARDFGMDMTQASQEEKQATKRLLVSLLTYGADISLQRFNVKWRSASTTSSSTRSPPSRTPTPADARTSSASTLLGSRMPSPGAPSSPSATTWTPRRSCTSTSSPRTPMPFGPTLPDPRTT